jgi:hypothetical protein
MEENIPRTPEPAAETQPFMPDAETLADAESLDYKHETLHDPAHKLQSRAGAVAGAIAGTALGTVVAGPIGALIGAVTGGISGGIGGKVAGEMLDPSAESEYWMKNHAQQPYADPARDYADYEPAYRAAYNNYTPGWAFEQAEEDIKRYYNENGGSGRLEWDEARPAAQAAWRRMEYIFRPEDMNTP